MGGDREALTKIVLRYEADMARLSFVIAGDADVAREAVERAWQRAVTRLGSVREKLELLSGKINQAHRLRAVAEPSNAKDIAATSSVSHSSGRSRRIRLYPASPVASSRRAAGLSGRSGD